jgi:hypothetical protein
MYVILAAELLLVYLVFSLAIVAMEGSDRVGGHRRRM